MGLKCLDSLDSIWDKEQVKRYRYQIKTAEQVVEKMDGRAILADEVGLGKTIEAGLVLCEYMKREGASRILILTPASLVDQWCEELQKKFNLRFSCNPKDRWTEEERIISSIDLAKRPSNRCQLTSQPFDVVVVDEAHSLKNEDTLNHQLVRQLDTRHLLLLSATPLQNDLLELYQLVSLVRPDLFGSLNQFQRQYLIDKRMPKDAKKLRRALKKVMIRNRRQDTPVDKTKRQVALLPVDLNPAEAELYDEVVEALREVYWQRDRRGQHILPLINLQREVCSSSAAVLKSLEHENAAAWLDDHLVSIREKAQSVQHQAKMDVLEGLLLELGGKAVVFTEFRATQDLLARQLKGAGLRTVTFHGGMSSNGRQQALDRFREEADVFISTEAGGQGLNLQFCRNLINYDLPWNPMRVEQRIGRVHRIGQAYNVRIFNMCARRTVEEHIVRLLDQKINLFREIIGNLDFIIRQLQRKRSFAGTILHIAMSSTDDQDMRRRFDALGDRFRQVKTRSETLYQARHRPSQTV